MSAPRNPRPTLFADELVKVPLEAVASIAATLVSQQKSPAESIKQAYQLLELAAAGRQSMIGMPGLEKEPSYEEGIAYLEKEREEEDKWLRGDQGPIDPNDPSLYKEEDGSISEVPDDVTTNFREALMSLKSTKSKRPSDLCAELKKWLINNLQMAVVEADTLVQCWKTSNEMPLGIYRLAYKALVIERPQWISQTKSASGSKRRNKSTLQNLSEVDGESDTEKEGQ